MIFIYKCWECNREIATEDPCVLMICVICMQEMKLSQVGQKKIAEEMIVQ